MQVEWANFQTEFGSDWVIKIEAGTIELGTKFGIDWVTEIRTELNLGPIEFGTELEIELGIELGTTLGIEFGLKLEKFVGKQPPPKSCHYSMKHEN
ncbi:hypothetical protein U1Q18_021305 [Sarracenia purpurea var. burkii]